MVDSRAPLNDGTLRAGAPRRQSRLESISRTRISCFLSRVDPAVGHYAVTSAAKGVEDVLRILEGRWKLVILFHLFGGHVRRFSELRRAIPAVSEKMLIQQLRQM